MVRILSSYKKLISYFMVVLLVTNTGCFRNYYKFESQPNPTIGKIKELKEQQNYFIVHQNYTAYHLNNLEIDIKNQSINGELQPLSKAHLKYKVTKPTPGKPNRYQLKETPHVINEIHLYVKNQAIFNNEEISIPISALDKIEIYDKHKGATIASYTLGSLGIAAGVVAVIAIIALIFTVLSGGIGVGWGMSC